MGMTGTMIAHCAKPGRGLAEGLCRGIDPASAARFPRGAEGVIRTNHPVFIMGHLALYPRRALQLAGLEAADIEVPAHYDDLFAAGKECRDAGSGAEYPPLEEVARCFFAGMDRAIERMPAAEDEVLARENPIEGFRSRAPTIGDAANFLLNNHTMFHLGQLSAWRRCLGLPSVM